MTSFESKVARIEAMFAAMGVRLGRVLIDYFSARGRARRRDKTEPGTTRSTSRLDAQELRKQVQDAAKGATVIDGRVVDAGISRAVPRGIRRARAINNDGNVRECSACRNARS